MKDTVWRVVLMGKVQKEFSSVDEAKDWVTSNIEKHYPGLQFYWESYIYTDTGWEYCIPKGTLLPIYITTKEA